MEEAELKQKLGQALAEADDQLIYYLCQKIAEIRSQPATLQGGTIENVERLRLKIEKLEKKGKSMKKVEKLRAALTAAEVEHKPSSKRKRGVVDSPDFAPCVETDDGAPAELARADLEAKLRYYEDRGRGNGKKANKIRARLSLIANVNEEDVVESRLKVVKDKTDKKRKHAVVEAAGAGSTECVHPDVDLNARDSGEGGEISLLLFYTYVEPAWTRSALLLPVFACVKYRMLIFCFNLLSESSKTMKYLSIQTF